jgi:hypothetical protein
MISGEGKRFNSGLGLKIAAMADARNRNTCHPRPAVARALRLRPVNAEPSLMFLRPTTSHRFLSTS